MDMHLYIHQGIIAYFLFIVNTGPHTPLTYSRPGTFYEFFLKSLKIYRRIVYDESGKNVY